ncbi:MAG TPA: hypothetical protein PKL79_03560, partial [Rectinema sp.]|nr:hypothetical protein [Rectinema sp.]
MLDRFFRGKAHHTKKKNPWLFIAIALIAVGVFLGFYFAIRGRSAKNSISRSALAKVWNSGNNIEQTLSEAQKAIESYPFDEYYLSICGIAYYYSALNAQEE